jgi:hypothetical protein
MSHAACADSPELPWIEEHSTTVGYPRRVMARICAECPVLADCDQYAQTSEVIAGFWAGRPRSIKPERDAGWPAEVPNPLDPTPAGEDQPAAAQAEPATAPPALVMPSGPARQLAPRVSAPTLAGDPLKTRPTPAPAAQLTAAVHAALRRYERAAHVFVPKHGPVASARLRLLVAIEALHQHADRPDPRRAHQEHVR